MDIQCSGYPVNAFLYIPTRLAKSLLDPPSPPFSTLYYKSTIYYKLLLVDRTSTKTRHCAVHRYRFTAHLFNLYTAITHSLLLCSYEAIHTVSLGAGEEKQQQYITDPSSRQRGRYKMTIPQLSKDSIKEKE
jgi:hypothetical protein